MHSYNYDLRDDALFYSVFTLLSPRFYTFTSVTLNRSVVQFCAWTLNEPGRHIFI